MRFTSFFLLLFGFGLISRAGAIAAAANCTVDASRNRFSIDPVVTFPQPYTYCFGILVNRCSTPSSPCCQNITSAALILDIDEVCTYDNITATFNGRPVSGVYTSAPVGGFGTIGVLIIPGLQLNATSTSASRSQVCIQLQRDTNCGSVTRLPPAGASRWNAVLSTDPTCCPTTTLRAPPNVRCDTCLVWDVLGPNGTASSAKYDFLSKNSCALASVDPSELERPFKNCCEYQAYWAFMGGFQQARADGLISGFNKPVCTRTSMRLCGSFNSRAAGQAFAADRRASGGLREDFDGSDDTCSMALIDSTVRLRSLLPSSGAVDLQCAPVNERIDDVCVEPERELWEVGFPPFPNSTCNSTAGITPFTMSKYYEVVYSRDQPSITAYCINITTTTPVRPDRSFCGNSTTLDRVAFWMFDDEYRREAYTGAAYLLTREGNGYRRTNLTAAWGAQGERMYNIFSLGLNTTLVATKQPKICIVAENSRVWLDTADGMGYLWTALYDRSGRCCPVYYANRF